MRGGKNASLQQLLNVSPKKGSKKGSRKSGATMGHLDIKSQHDVKTLMSHMGKTPIIVMFVYANWCGHCHKAMPIYKEAVRTATPGVLNVSVESEQLDNVSKAIPSIKENVEGFPTILVMDKDGHVSSKLSASPENIRNATSGNVGTPAVASRLSSEPIGQSPEMVSNEDLLVEQMGTVEDAATAAAVSAAEDQVASAMNTTGASQNSMKGGSLYGALASSAYSLAPAGALMGLAAYTLGRRGLSRRGPGRRGLSRRRPGRRGRSRKTQRRSRK